MANTRLCPTTNGPGLHLGHICMALVNEAEAHSTGGRFLVRFDDNQKQWMDKQAPGEARGYADRMREDLEWFGIRVDGYSFQTDVETWVPAHEIWNRLTGQKYPLNNLTQGASQSHAPEVPTDPSSQYPYAPFLTAEKVVFDYMQKIDLLIRGFDLLGEYSLYSYLCDLWNIPIPRQIFLPRLQLSEGKGFNSRVDVSKTSSKCMVRDMKKAFSAASLQEMLAIAYLKAPEGPWLASNVKAMPVLKGGS